MKLLILIFYVHVLVNVVANLDSHDAMEVYQSTSPFNEKEMLK